MRIIAIINRRAGAMIGADHADVAATVGRLFRAAGHQIEVNIVEPQQVTAFADTLDPAAADVFLVGGGDGTIRSFAQRLSGTRAALGILPMGTMNRLARDLMIPLQLDAAVRSLGDAQIRAIDVGEVNGRVFVCNSFLGVPPEYSELRQALRGRPALHRLNGYLGILRTVFATRRRIALSIHDGRQPRVFRALSLAVSNNPYGEGPSSLLYRPRLTSGMLALYLSRHRSVLAMYRLLLLAMLGVWRFDDPEFEFMQSESFRIDMKKTSVKVCNDGEVERLRLPLEYRIRPAALRVLMPLAAVRRGLADGEEGVLPDLVKA
ncbi:MAG: hypothetical protein KDK91_25360 [Gammaproteobacteria bacterium]|nr:hypothetical protein [Gammaproteobacteria bacterium]